MNHSRIIVVGGGPAGMMAAIEAARKGSQVTILEKMPRIGRKLMLTGKGRCNFTNVKSWENFSSHIHPDESFARNAFFSFPPLKVMEFFESQGVECVVERGDRVFPASHLASDIVDALASCSKSDGVAVRAGISVQKIRQLEDGTFRLETSGGGFTCERLIITTGGLSYPSTGSTGDGYAWAQNFGHTIRPLLPSLTALVPRGYKKDASTGHISRQTPLSEAGKALCGISLKNISISLYIDGNLSQSEEGDLDFTDGGMEGPIGFKLSRKAVCAIAGGSRLYVTIDFKPAVEVAALSARIASLWKEISAEHSRRPFSYKYKALLYNLLPSQMADAFIMWGGAADTGKLAASLKSFRLDIDGYVGYERCVVTQGGVSLGEVNRKTMESKKVKGLYFAGEILDIDADTGGYNLQIAFCTGALAGRSAAEI